MMSPQSWVVPQSQNRLEMGQYTKLKTVSRLGEPLVQVNLSHYEKAEGMLCDVFQ
jgi:hypothetical protein